MPEAEQTITTCHVTGATGFIGSALCRRMRDRGWRCAASGRNLISAAGLQGIETLVHCAGVAHQSAEEILHQQANFHQVVAQAEQAAAAGVRNFIFLSTVNADPRAGPYGYWKWRAEQALTAQYRDAAMAVVCLRPALVYGAGARGNLATLLGAVRRGLPAPPALGRRSLVGVDDLCRSIMMLARLRFPEALCLTATDGEVYDLRRIHAAFSHATGRTPGRQWLPLWVWHLGCKLLDIRHPGQNYFEKLFGEKLCDNRALTELGWHPAQTLEQVAPRMAATST